MNDLSILFDSPPGGLAAEKVAVKWEGSWPKITAEAQRRIEERWQVYLTEARQNGRTLFNAPVTQLLRAERDGDGVQLTVGPTDYKTFVVTVLRDREWFESRAPQAMTPALGNSALVTCGDQAILGIRSARVSAYAGRAHLIGGVLEKLGNGAIPSGRAGILTHLRTELSEEIGISDDASMSHVRLLALVRDEFLAQPELIWQYEVQMNLDEIKRRIMGEEHSAWLIVFRQTLEPDVAKIVTPVALAAWERWRRSP